LFEVKDEGGAAAYGLLIGMYICVTGASGTQRQSLSFSVLIEWGGI
jgi:Na+-translocating ferredoxin:NAD+ oxidoreductase RnfD subunit